MSLTNQLTFLAVQFVMVASAAAETVRIPLPGLLGPQTVENLDWTSAYFARRSVDIPRSSQPTGSKFIGFEWSGTIDAGRVVGDGITREPIEQILRGSFSSDLSGPSHTIARIPATLPTIGHFQEFWQLDALPGGFIDRNCIDCVYPPDVVTVRLGLVPDYFALGDSIPFLEPPDWTESLDANRGLILLEGIEADVTSAALVYEVVPEPGTAIMVLIALHFIGSMRYASVRTQ